MSEGRLAFPRLYLYAQAASSAKEPLVPARLNAGLSQDAGGCPGGCFEPVPLLGAFAVRVHKRGEHGYPEPAPVLERRRGSAHLPGSAGP